MSIWKILGFVILGVAINLVLRKMKDEYAYFVSIVLCLGLTLCAVEVLIPVIEYLESLGDMTSSGEMFSLMFKSCGIAIITTLAASVCRDSGETALASKAELCGKSMILAMALPLVKQVFDTAREIIG